MRLSPSRALFGAALVTLGCSFAACGLDESGLLTGDASTSDVITNEAGGDAKGDAPVACATLDASCLGQGAPAGWAPIAYQENVTGCGDAGGFQEVAYVTEAGVAAGGCVCSGCNAVGSWSCVAELWTGPTCPGVTTYTDASTCWGQFGGHFGGSVTRTGNPSCTSGVQLDASVAAVTPASVCVPTSCAADYCGLVKSGFQGCIWNLNAPDASCPQNFTARTHTVGTSATPQCSCPSCKVSNTATGTCSGGTVTAYGNSNCTTFVASSPMNGGCQDTTASGGYQSMYYDAGPTPEPLCQPLSAATGTATLDSPTTICCSK